LNVGDTSISIIESPLENDVNDPPPSAEAAGIKAKRLGITSSIVMPKALLLELF
tara:strand:+ start:412 stop:573 length:162 start_codon:yes stop_codon:yes gene_type:complete